MAQVRVFSDSTELARAVATAFLSRMQDAQASGEVPHVALTGGSIASAVHREIARLAPHYRVDWERISLWWGDERFVARSSAERNAGQARADLLDVVGATQVHEMPSSDDAASPQEAADLYSQTVRAHGSGEFDLVMLGIGPDGHVASLFPGSAQLDATDAVAVGVTDSPKPPPGRVTLTFEALNRTRATWMLVSGAEKAQAVAAALAPSGDVHDTPARGISPPEGGLTWFVDRSAAANLPAH